MKYVYTLPQVLHYQSFTISSLVLSPKVLPSRVYYCLEFCPALTNINCVYLLSACWLKTPMRSSMKSSISESLTMLYPLMNNILATWCSESIGAVTLDLQKNPPSPKNHCSSIGKVPTLNCMHCKQVMQGLNIWCSVQ